MKRILIVDDDTTLALMLQTWLSKKGFRAKTVSSVDAGRRALAAEPFDIVLTDMRLPDQDGICLLQWIAEQGLALPVIVMTGYAEIQNAVQSMKLGARDYIAKPVRPEELLRKIEEALRPLPESAGPQTATQHGHSPLTGHASVASAPSDDGQYGRKGLHTASSSVAAPDADYLEGSSDASRKLYEYVRLVAPTNLSVLINGASGTGKEHIARLIHDRSKRSGRPFVAIDCGTIPRELAASEFFGHVKGSFTGAVGDKTGAFEAANGGTLFLDEVGNLSYEIQIQLLRALQERHIKPVGSNRDVPIDIRVIAATNENLEEAISRGAFRIDLYHRLNGFTLRMPELREIRQDIPLFADFFLDQANRELDKRIVGFDAGAIDRLTAYDWPGNLRQLKNTVMYATLLATGEYITCGELPDEIAAPAHTAAATAPLRDPASEEERIRRALAAAGGNKSQAAKLLGIDRKTLYNKLRNYGIE